jgi:hypothetical protein
MSTNGGFNYSGRFYNGFAAVVLGIVLLAFSLPVMAQTYQGAEYCLDCHDTENYNDWKASGHPYKLMKGSEAQYRPIPLPNGYVWDDISYVIGGYKWKSRYMDKDGYIITKSFDENGLLIDGVNQYNYLTGTWSNYNAGQANLPYNCGACHTTGWVADTDAATDGTLEDNQDGLPGIHGTFAFGGVHCEACHGPGDEMSVNTSAEFCGTCHFRGALNTIPASGGFIRHHEQYNEHLAGTHASLDCVTCHNPHKRGEFSIKEDAQCGVSCHASKMTSFAKTSMYDYGVTCADCHMPFATKSALALGPHEGDVMTHIFRIDTDPNANMFTEDGGFVALDGDGKAAVTLDFACQRCHETASLAELAKYAKNFHDDKGLEDVGVDPGLTGTWWNAARSGEGFVLQFGYVPGTTTLTLFASFYTYDDQGNQTWLVALPSSISGTTVNVDVYITSGRMWGDAFDPDDGATSVWGTGTFTFPTCTSGTVSLMPNADALAAGFSNLSYALTRDDFLGTATACPTFVNNAN